MANNIGDVFQQALELDPIDRARLIESLYQSFDQENDEEHSEKWAEEVESRIDAYDQGKLQADTAEEVFKRLRQK